MKWLKYRHKFSHGTNAWQWRVVSGEATEDSVRDEEVASLAEQYSYSDKYRGLDFEVVESAPAWVVQQKVDEARSAERAAKRSQSELEAQRTAPCAQCDTAMPWRIDISNGKRVECPTCGQAVESDSMKFWLSPSDTEAVALLGSLVVHGKRTTRGVRAFETGADSDAFGRLVQLGLALGTVSSRSYTIAASERGVAEWAKHKPLG